MNLQESSSWKPLLKYVRGIGKNNFREQFSEIWSNFIQVCHDGEMLSPIP